VSRPELYYYVREPQSQADYEPHAQGFAKKVEFLGELFDGMVSVDGLINMSLNFGDSFTCEVKPEYSLKTVKFLL